MYSNSLLVKFDKQLIYGHDVVSKTNFGPVCGSYTLETEISIWPVYAWNYVKFLPSWYWHKADMASQGHISLVGSSVVRVNGLGLTLHVSVSEKSCKFIFCFVKQCKCKNKIFI